LVEFGRLLVVDLSKQEHKVLQVGEDVVRAFIGGKGLGAYLLHKLLKPGTDPLSPENLLMFLTGPLTGTGYPTSGRMVVVTKSPLTNLFLDSHAGGWFGPELRRAGFDGLVIKGSSDEPVYLWLSEDGLEFRDASHIWGQPVGRAVELVRAETDPGAHVAVIGPAGENLVRFAAIIFDRDEDPWRSGVAGRGGAGAVMGSKRLKAVAVRARKGRVSIHDGKAFRKLVKHLYEKMKASPFYHIRRAVGTSYWVEPMNRLGFLPTRNFTSGFIEGHYGLTGSYLRAHVARDVGCAYCPMKCGKVVHLPEGAVKVEYEILAMMGADNGLTDALEVAKSVKLATELGLDGISTGVVIGFAMEAGRRGLLKDVPDFGDAEGQRELVKKIAYREGIGDLLAEGVKRAAEKLGPEAIRIAVHVKGLELPGYDPRASWGMALAYATADRGGCHQRAWTVRAEIDGRLKRFSTEGLAEFVKYVQDERAAAFSLIVCDFAPLGVEDFISGLRVAAGLEYDVGEYLTVGERIWNLVRLFNMREAGVSRADDTLPPRMFEEPLPMPDGREARIGRATLERLLDEYYALRGWDGQGRPSPEKLRELGLDKLV